MHRVRLMPDRKPVGRLRRFTDAWGVTDPGEPLGTSIPGYMLAFGIVTLGVGLVWLIPAIINCRAGKADFWHLTLGIIYLCLSNVGFLRWRRPRNRRPGPDE